nr:MAG TPA: hypothetical protein [Caudoviricetes sp.]
MSYKSLSNGLTISLGGATWTTSEPLATPTFDDLNLPVLSINPSIRML